MTILFSILYNFVLLLGVLLYLPKLIRKWHPNFLGLGLKEVKRKCRGAIWFHGVSLGEIKALAPLVAKLRIHYRSTPFIFTTCTRTGYNEAKKIYPNDTVFYLPLDFSFIIKPLVKAIHPKYLIFSETDVWYNLLQASKGRNVIVSAKLSERSASRYKWIAKPFFSKIDLICCQNERYKERYKSLGIPESKLKVTGNLKYDVTYPKSGAEKTKTIVLGSTHAPEEMELLERMPDDYTIVLVPRHPERFDEVAALLKEKGIPFYRTSEPRPEQVRVILVDEMGKLLQFYEQATLAIVGGSYKPVGGHNILEPLAYGTPVIFGPHMHTQFELVELVLKANAGLQVPLEDLKDTVTGLLQNPARLHQMGENGKKLIASLQGVADQTLSTLL